MSNFVVIDFETANSNSNSICQIGVVNFENSEKVSSWETYINPNDKFSRTNTLIHGIKAEDVSNAPTFADIYEKLNASLSNKIVVSHGSFDRTALRSAIQKFKLDAAELIWLDATLVARRVLPQFSKKGYGLQNLARYYGIATIPHNALNDALTCGLVLNNLLSDSNKSIDEWMHDLKHPAKKTYSSENKAPTSKLTPNEDGDFFGVSICVTGKLSFGNRQQSHELISNYGFTIHNAPKHDTDFLLIGEQVAHNIGPNGKSDKEEDLEKAIAQGGRIRPISEYDFKAMCGIDSAHKVQNVKRILPPMEFDFEFNEEKFLDLLSNPDVEIGLDPVFQYRRYV